MIHYFAERLRSKFILALHNENQYIKQFSLFPCLKRAWSIKLPLLLPPLHRSVLCQPGGTQGPDEDGSEHAPHRSRELPAGSAGARRGAPTHQPPQAGPGHGVRHLQRGRSHVRPCGESTDAQYAYSHPTAVLQI